MRLRRCALGLLVAVAARRGACSRKPASIDVSPKKVKIYGIERAQRLTARVLDKKGQPLESGGAHLELLERLGRRRWTRAAGSSRRRPARPR